VVAGLSTIEIASLLDLKEAAVRQRLARARKQFQQLYTSESGEEVYDSTQSHSTPSTHPSDKESVEQQALDDTSQRLKLTTPPPKTWRSYA